MADSVETKVIPEEHLPSVYHHAVKVYRAMEERAVDSPKGRMYVGALVRLFEEIGLGVSVYTQTTRCLKAMKCAEMLERGGGGSPSKWILHQAPSSEAFSLVQPRVKRIYGSHRSRNTKTEALEQQVRDLQKRLEVLENDG